ncbi:MAG TPA: Asp-tRNA(Asn)/Glu-tRNA(Gln) amidotransferase subunit GatC [Clostridiaceae bacterium]
MSVTIEEVNYIAKLAKIKFSEEEVIKITSEFDSIFNHFKSIDSMDLKDVDLNVFDKDSKSVVRADTPVIFEDKKKLFQNAKAMRDTYIEVPKIIE